MDMKTFHAIQLAALLHDIDIFLGEKDSKASIEFISSNAELLSRFVDPEVLRQLIHKCQNDNLINQESTPVPPELSIIMNQADQYSFSKPENNARISNQSKRIPLSSVFTRLRLSPEKALPPKELYHPLPLTPRACFPESSASVAGAYQKNFEILLRKFNERLSSLAKDAVEMEFDGFFTRLLALFQEFTWVIPYGFHDDQSDISLFDHLKTTAAIASVLYLYHNERGDFSEENILDRRTEKFRLIVGDLSGIQNYIFSEFTITSKGAAKSLRARSFILAMLGEVVSHWLLELFNLSPANILMASGGKFYILVPNLRDSDSKINQLQHEIDSLLIKRFRGEVGLNLGQVAFNGEAFNSFDLLLREVNQTLDLRRRTPFKPALQPKRQWDEAAFVLNLSGKPEYGICEGCGKSFAETVEDEFHFCLDCLSERELGKKLTQANYLFFYKNPSDTKEKFHVLGEYWVVPARDEAPPGTEHPYLVMRLNDPDLSGITDPALFRFTATQIPADPVSGVPLDFDHIAQQASGRPLLGYLKMDVDHLGALFFFGLSENEHRNDNNISRLTTLSRMLDLFFAGYINQLLAEKYPSCYAVFAGGDDLFLIGPWDRIIDLAREIQREFSRFVSHNPNVTLSCGISVCKPRFPVGRGAKLAEETLEQAKETVIKGQTESRNQIHVFGRTIKWPDFPDLLIQAKKFTDFIKQKQVNAGFVYRLLNYEAMFQSYYQEGKIEGLKYIALLSYDMARNLNLKEEEVKGWIEELKNINLKKTVYLRFILEYALNLTRGAENGELS